MATNSLAGGQESTAIDSNRAEGLAGLYRDHASWLKRRLAASRPPRGLEIDDVVQETYVRAARYEAADAGRHPRALLLRIAVNLVRDYARKNRDAAGRSLLLAANDRAEGLAAAAGPDQEYLVALKQIILELPPELRDVFLLSRFTPMTYREIATHLGLTEKAVEWRLSKALALCAKRLHD